MTWAAINRQYNDIAPDFLKLVDLVYTIPATSAEAERGFSVMKGIKTDCRNRLKEGSLNTLFRIKLLSPEEADFDPEKAVEHWMASSKRRVRETQSRPANTTGPEVDVLEESFRGRRCLR